MRILLTAFGMLVLGAPAHATPLTSEEHPSALFQEWELPLPMQPIWVGVADTLYGYWQNGIWESADKGESWTEIHHFADMLSDCRALFVDSRGSVLASRLSRGALQLGKYRGGESRTWSEPLPFECQERFWKMCEDSLGNLFVGEYAGDWEDTCAFIYRSSDGGDTWDRVYEGTERHVHFVAANPYNGCLYASIGDGDDRRKVMRSTNTGETWETIIPTTYPCSHPVSIVFTPSHRFFGSDCANNRIYSTSDDSLLVDNLVLTGTENAYVWGMSRNSDGMIVAGTRVPWFGDTVPGIYVSQDHGQHWCRVKNWGVQPEKYGVKWMSNFDGDGYAYYHENVTGKTYRFCFGGTSTATAHSERDCLAGCRVVAYPNPFKTETYIWLNTLEGIDSAKLSVHDLHGRIVSRIFSRRMDRGGCYIRWDGMDDLGHCVPAGVYFVKVELDGRPVNLKVTRIR